VSSKWLPTVTVSNLCRSVKSFLLIQRNRFCRPLAHSGSHREWISYCGFNEP